MSNVQKRYAIRDDSGDYDMIGIAVRDDTVRFRIPGCESLGDVTCKAADLKELAQEILKACEPKTRDDRMRDLVKDTHPGDGDNL